MPGYMNLETLTLPVDLSEFVARDLCVLTQLRSLTLVRLGCAPCHERRPVEEFRILQRMCPNLQEFTTGVLLEYLECDQDPEGSLCSDKCPFELLALLTEMESAWRKGLIFHLTLEDPSEIPGYNPCGKHTYALPSGNDFEFDGCLCTHVGKFCVVCGGLRHGSGELELLERRLDWCCAAFRNPRPGPHWSERGMRHARRKSAWMAWAPRVDGPFPLHKYGRQQQPCRLFSVDINMMS
jgi:hypothetical protein